MATTKGISSFADISALPTSSVDSAKGSPSKGEKIDASKVFKSLMHNNLTGGKDKGSIGNDGKKLVEGQEKTVKYQNQGLNSIKTKKAVTTKDKLQTPSAKETLEKFQDGIKDAIKEKFDVSDEDIEKALETLGITVVDLVNPTNLANLVSELSGGLDQASLLVGEEFKALFDVVQDLTNQLQNALGLKDEEMVNLSQTVEEIETDINSTEDAVKVENSNAKTVEVVVEKEDVVEQNPTEVAEKVDTSNLNKDKANKTAENVIKEDNNVDETEAVEEVKVEVEDEDEESVGYKNNSKTQEETKSQNVETDNTKDTTFETTKQNVTKNESTDNLHAQSLNAETPVNNVNNQGQVAQERYINNQTAIDLINQLADNVKVTIQAKATTMEMQLDPESLGKIFLQVTAREGAVHAQIAAQNEAIKNAILGQLSSLKDNLNQAGIKVDAIEVTVASHEFERNLEQGSRQDEKNANTQQGNLKVLRRNIKLSDLDEISGVMTEEEELVAQIMKDNGNSVDMTA
ncbi:flagellar hook-length control protein FliK [Lachnospiraceae bacterium C7]|nr:flagellar hook-length control protein FliK [Lachnospiraceae bacterium C7]